jgi:transposase InsO family protein
MTLLLLLFALVAIWIARATHRPPHAEKSEIRRHTKRETQSELKHASNVCHYRAKPIEVRESLFRIALEAPDASCRTIADRFNRDHVEQGWSVGKTYVAEFLREFKQWRAAPRRHSHSIDSVCAVNRVWAIDLTEHRIEPQTPQPLPGILDHGSRRMLTFLALRDRSSIAILRWLLDAIEYYGKPKAIRTDNEAIFTSWVFAFALQWLGIRHQRTLPHCPWMNGRIERVWSTFKQVLRICHIPDEVELQATLNMLRDVYNQRRPHQSLSGYTPNEA